MDFFDNIGMTFTTMLKISEVCLCYQIVCLIQIRHDFLRSPSNEDSDTNFLDFLSMMHSQSSYKNAVVKTRLERHRPI